MPSRARHALVVSSLVGAAMLAAGVEPAQACSCARGDPRTQLARAQAAFVGVFLGSRTLNATESIYRFRVQRAVKGRLGETVEVQSSSSGASCGIEARPGQVIGLFLYRRGQAWTSGLCFQIAPASLREAAQPLPRPTGSGSAALLVGGRFGPARTIALDAAGRILRYGHGSGETLALSVCPGGKRVAEWIAEPAGGQRVAVRDVGTMRVLWQRTLPAPAAPAYLLPTSVFCRQASGDALLAFATNAGSQTSATPVSRIYRVSRGGITTVHRGTASACGVGTSTAYVTQGRLGQQLVSIDLRTGRTRFLAQIPRGLGSIAVSPDGRRLAGVTYRAPTGRSPPPSLSVLVDLTRPRARVRSRPLGGPNVSGDMAWLNPRRLVFLPGRGDEDLARVYDTALRVRGSFGGWLSSQSIVARGAAYGLAGDVVVRAKLPHGPVRSFRRLPGPLTHALAGLH